MASSDPIVITDLFAGCGGLTTGAALACEDLSLDLGTEVRLHAINHDENAIESHERNHPWAEHYHAGIEELHPPDVAEPGTVDLMLAGPECTHFSSARGGEPVKEQKRVPAFLVLDWIFKLRPENILVENVKEFRSWGSIDTDGQPTRDGHVFDKWLETIEKFGYTVDHEVLNAADYGDPTSRRRLFIVASRTQKASYPDPTHAEEPGPDDDREPWRTAAEIIDWSDLGGSLWTRDLENPRVQPLSENTMARIAEGIRRHCADRLGPLADALAKIGPARLEELRENAIPLEYAEIAAEWLDDPFLVRCSANDRSVLTDPYLVKYYGTSSVRPTTAPLDTVTADGNHHALSLANSYLLGQHSSNLSRDAHERPVPTVSTVPRVALSSVRPYLLRQQSGGVPADATADPLPTVCGGGAIGLASPLGRPLVKPRNGAARGLHSNPLYPPEQRPMHTVTAKNHDGHLVTARASPVDTCSPFIDDYEGPPDSLEEPVGTITTKDRFALVVPEVWPWGLDVHYRMLKPAELKQAQGFPADYDLAGDTKRAITEQIGNAVPVNLAKALCKHLLGRFDPSLSSFDGGLKPHPDAGVPEYEEVISADD